MRSVIAHSFIVGTYIFVFIMGITCGIESKTEHSASYDLLSADEQEARYLMSKTTPTTVLVRIKTPEEILEEAKGVSSSAIALAILNNQPCEIWLPTGMMIGYRPKQKAAVWLDKSDGDTFAHELLHCMRGAWHPQ